MDSDSDMDLGKKRQKRLNSNEEQDELNPNKKQKAVKKMTITTPKLSVSSSRQTKGILVLSDSEPMDSPDDQSINEDLEEDTIEDIEYRTLKQPSTLKKILEMRNAERAKTATYIESKAEQLKVSGKILKSYKLKYLLSRFRF